MPKILIVEDDSDIEYLIKIHIKDLGYAVESAPDGIKGFEMALTGGYCLIILDVMLPGMDGLQVCQKLREAAVNSPILMLTSRGEEFDKVMGLESGADDYMTKPFGIREFTARVKAIIRREQRRFESSEDQSLKVLQFGPMSIDKEKRKVFIDGEKVALTPKEFDLLLLLSSSPGKYFSREQLLEQVWGYDFSGYDHTVSTHINRLRGKIEKDLNNPRFILTSWSVGYCFNDDIK
jgi:DNA-binding response OmpR family regulator